ncbi:MAG: organic hydroperoxide resistance protein [Bdellovibrionia bacterium]
MAQLAKRLYETTSVSTGGRDGHTRSLDGNFKAELSTPKELGGPGGAGTNPEQLFASGYSACFLNAVKYICFQEKVAFDANASSAKAKVAIGPAEVGFGLQVELTIELPNLDQEKAEEIVKKAHATCPYSNAIRGNVDVSIAVVGK